MSRAGVNNEACPICGSIPYDSERRVLVRGRLRESYCSQACLRVGVRTIQLARRKRRLRGAACFVAFALVIAGVGYVRHRLRAFRAAHAPVATAAPAAATAPPEETPFGPHWPPTDEDWLAEFAHAAWVHPLPGPTRRPPVGSPQRFVTAAADKAAAAPDKARARCRNAGHCGVGLDGDLWGEHVYAAHDGVIDRLQRSGDDARGGVSVRIAHWGGVVFTQYSQLAAIPTHLAVGMHVDAGDVIGLAGDGGGGREHVHFALSVRPSSDATEVYWDPEPLMATWPLRTPERGSVAGLLSPEAPAERIAGMPSARRHLAQLPQLPAKSRRAGDATPGR